MTDRDIIKFDRAEFIARMKTVADDARNNGGQVLWASGIEYALEKLSAVESLPEPEPQRIIEIHARRWFNKNEANTYHSVSVLVDGELIGSVDYEYGYGESYLQTAHAILQDKGFYPKTGQSLPSGAKADYHQFRQDMMDGRHKFIVTCADVKRKKDL